MKNQKIVLLLVWVVATFLIFFRLTRHDMLGDDAHYAFRSIGYFDFMASEEQTTPIQWFGSRPWWSYLSFHDHPPLVFVIQHIFFKLFGTSILVSRLPSALAAVGSVLIVYFIGKRLGGSDAGLLSATALALNSYFVWTGRISLLESIFSFFLLLGLLYIFKSLQEDEKFFPLAWFYLGLSMLSKYTFLFAVPALLLYLIWKERSVFRNSRFWVGVGLFLIVISPVVIYNFAMFQSRGHFDVQFADLFNQSREDWPKLVKRVTGDAFVPKTVLLTLVDGFSWPYFLIFLTSLVGSIFIASSRIKSLYLAILIVFSLFLFLSLVGGAARWLGVFSGFSALVIGTSLSEFFKTSYYARAKYLFNSALILMAVFSAFYVFNTNTLRKPIGSNWLYANTRIESFGYNQLDQEISKLLSKTFPPEPTREVVRQWWFRKFKPEAISFTNFETPLQKPFNSLIIYDSNTEWFPSLWIFEKWKLYYRFFITTGEEYLYIAKNEDGLKVLKELDLNGIYLIEAADQVAARSEIKLPEFKLLVQGFKNQDIKPQIVYDDQGREAFYIYYGSFK